MRQLFSREKGFYRHLLQLALPMILQNLITTSLGFADTFMVGLLGNAEMAAVTAANVPIFIIQVVIFGFQSGMAILVSQYWGKGDTDNINRCMGVALYAVMGFAIVLAVLTSCFPLEIMRLITPNETLVRLGAPYLKIVGISYLFNAASSIYVAVQRSTEFPVFGMLLFALSMLTNTVLNYILIFGKFGAPMLGVEGAAIATLISRIVEFAAAVVFALINRRIPLRLGLIFAPGKHIIHSFIHYSGPVVLNETLWSVGTSMLTVVMGHMANSQDMLAAYALVGNIDKFSTVACFGVAASSAVIVGKEIGSGKDFDHVYSVSRTLLALSMGIGGGVMVFMLTLLPTFFLPVLFPLFELSEGSTTIAICMSLVYALFMPIRSFDTTNIIGILRAGGDSKIASVIDISPLWLITLPAMALSALVFHAPTWVICVMMCSESILKCPIGLLRFRSKKWIHNITEAVAH